MQQTEGKCPVCGGNLYQRNDDKPETISTRLNAYHEQTEPLIGYYSGQDKESRVASNRLRTVNGDSRPEEVFKAILATLE